jgi:hypothetical protein
MQLTIKHFCSIHQTELQAKESRDSKGTNIFVETCKDCLESVAKKNYEAGIQEYLLKNASAIMRS